MIYRVWTEDYVSVNAESPTEAVDIAQDYYPNWNFNRVTEEDSGEEMWRREEN